MQTKMNIQRRKHVPASFCGLPPVQGRMAGCLYSEEDRADSNTPGLCLHTLWHTHPPLHTAEIERLTMFSISNTYCEYKGLTGGALYQTQTTQRLFLLRWSDWWSRCLQLQTRGWTPTPAWSAKLIRQDQRETFGIWKVQNLKCHSARCRRCQSSQGRLFELNVTSTCWHANNDNVDMLMFTWYDVYHISLLC